MGQLLWKTVCSSPQESKIELPYDPAFLLLSVPKRNENMYTQKLNFYTNGYSYIFLNRQEMEISQMCVAGE